MTTQYKLILVKTTEQVRPEGFKNQIYPDIEKTLFQGEINPEEMIEILSHAFDLLKRRKDISE